jgi:glycosyltransferase involved in cell wall biosynthesis
LEFPKIDVVVLTKDSERLLRACLESIYTNIPLNRLIIVDNNSKDKTLEILSEFKKKHGNVLVIQDQGTRGTARQKGLSSVVTDWFMFVDSDVVLCDGWFEKARRYMQEDVGAIWGTEIWSTIRNPTLLKLFLRATRKIFEVRGGTHDTLVRFATVKEMKIPSRLHVFEDAYIKKWITKKGYKLIACYNPYCIHYRSQNVWGLKGSLRIMIDALRFGSLRTITSLLLAYGFYTAYSIYQFVLSNVKH